MIFSKTEPTSYAIWITGRKVSPETLCCCADSPLISRCASHHTVWFVLWCCALGGADFSPRHTRQACHSVRILDLPSPVTVLNPKVGTDPGRCGQTLPRTVWAVLQLPPGVAEESAVRVVISQMKWEVLKFHAKIENNKSGIPGAFSVYWFSSYIRGLAHNSYST